MQEGAHQNDAAPMYLERSLHYRKEEKVDQVEYIGGGVGVGAPGFGRFEDYKCSESWRQGGSSSSLKS